jgi:hypothetical protein
MWPFSSSPSASSSSLSSPPSEGPVSLHPDTGKPLSNSEAANPALNPRNPQGEKPSVLPSSLAERIVKRRFSSDEGFLRLRATGRENEGERSGRGEGGRDGYEGSGAYRGRTMAVRRGRNLAAVFVWAVEGKGCYSDVSVDAKRVGEGWQSLCVEGAGDSDREDAFLLTFSSFDRRFHFPPLLRRSTDPALSPIHLL